MVIRAKLRPGSVLKATIIILNPRGCGGLLCPAIIYQNHQFFSRVPKLHEEGTANGIQSVNECVNVDMKSNVLSSHGTAPLGVFCAFSFRNSFGHSFNNATMRQ